MINKKEDIIGKSIPAMDAFNKLTGKATFVADLGVPQMLYAKVAGSLYPHAKVKEINVKEIESLPGVKAVLTRKDMGERMFGSNFTRVAYLIEDHARCVGDVIAAVVAETEEIAESAIEMMKVQYEIMEPVFDPVEAMKPDAPKLYPEGNITDDQGNPQLLEYGNVDEGLKEVDLVVEGVFKMPKVLHAAVEPRVCLARWNGDKLEVWTSTQTPYYVQKNIAQYFETLSENISVSVPAFGGGFGGKYQEEYIAITCLLAKRTGKPVKLAYTRDMENMTGRARYGAITKIKVGAKKDGTITAQDIEQYYDVGAYGSPMGGSGVTMGAVNASIYRTDNCRIKAWNVCTNTITAQKFRSVYVPTYRFAIETLMDMLEEKLGKKPGDVRLEQVVKVGEMIKPYGNEMGNHAIAACLSKAKETANWDNKWKGWREPVEIRGKKHRGIGIAFGVGWCDWYRERHEGTTVELHPNGKVIISTGVTDIGTCNLTSISQIVAQALGFSTINNISVIAPNTFEAGSVMPPWDEGTIASRTLFVGGWAAKLAADQVREKLLNKAAMEWKVDTSKLEFLNGIIYNKENPELKLQLNDLISEPLVESAAPPKPNVVGRAKRYEKYIAPVEVHIAEVEVDTDTWEVKVVNYVAAHDVGKAINPRVVENQLEGGIIQGISTTLYEELIFDRERNRYSNPDFVDYKVATINDVPPIKIIMLEEAPAEYGPFGAKGIGEHPLPPVYGAIGNAVYNAVGIRPMEVPITPERMFKWSSEKG